MKLFKHCLRAILLITMLLGSVSVVRAQELQKTIKIGAYNNSPKIYKDVNDQPAGVYADLLKYIAEKEGWKIEYVWGQWDECLNRLEKGEIDLMVDVAISPEREKRFDFTKETVMNSWAVIYVQKNSDINSLLDLEGKKISILKSSVYEGGVEGIDQYLNAFGIKADVEEVTSYRQALDLLELGKVDAAVVSYISGLTNQKNYENIKATKIFLKPTELRFALTKGDPDNPDLIEKLDFWIWKLKDGEDGYFKATLEKYGLAKIEFQESPMENKETAPSQILPIIKIVLASIMLLGLMQLIVLRLLRRDNP